MLPRKVRKTEKQDVINHFITDMVGESRRLRFGYQAPDEAVIKYIERSWTGLENRTENWFVVKDKGRIVATCHIVLFDKTHAEMGCTVSPDYQGKRIGQALFERGTNWARSKGAEAICMQCLSENKVIQHIAQKSGMTTFTLSPGEKEAVTQLTQSELVASQQDALDDTMAVYDSVMRDNSWMMEKFFNMLYRVE
jgi:RimJ/RimL family protein N-acetyltransferase